MSLVRFRPEAPLADLAHLVERDLAKVEVAGSSPVIRSTNGHEVKTIVPVTFAIMLSERRADDIKVVCLRAFPRGKETRQTADK